MWLFAVKMNLADDSCDDFKTILRDYLAEFSLIVFMLRTFSAMLFWNF